MYRYLQNRIDKEIENKYRKLTQRDVSVEHNNAVQDKRFITMMTSISHTYGNVLAWLQQYILDMMPENLFKTIHVNSKIAHRQIRSTNHEFLRKPKPIIIFRPRIADMDEDRFLKGTMLIQKQYDLYNTRGATNLQPFFNDPKNDIVIKFQQNRAVMYVDVVMFFSTLMNQIDYVHYLENLVTWNSSRFCPTFLESYIPQEMLKIISDISGIPLFDEENSTKSFLRYLEQNCEMPVTYKLQGSSGTREFYRYYPTNIDLTFTNLNWDDGEKAGHVMNQYQVSFTCRLEFYTTGFYYLFSDNIFDLHLPVFNPETDNVIPIYTDVLEREDLNLRPGWHLFNKASCVLEKEYDSICIDELLNNSIRTAIKYHQDNGIPLVEFLDIKVRKQGKLQHENRDYTIDYDTMTINFRNTSPYYTYRILVCINVEYINDLVKTIFNLK